MLGTLDILIVEDQANDAKQLVRALREHGFEPRWERVETEADYLTKLKPSLDLIFSDYHLPEFDGLRALHLLQESGFDVPFIIVYGTASEVMAPAAMKAGACDFIMKENLVRLAPAVERELHEARQRRGRRALELALAAQEDLLRGFFNASPAGMVILDSELRFLRINQTLAAINGPSVPEHLGKTVQEVLPHLASTLEPVVRTVLALGRPVLNVEVSGEVPSQPGVVRHWVESYFPIPGPSGAASAVGSVVLETTERKKAEEALRKSEERFRELTENISEVFWMSDPKTTRILYVSPAYEKVWGRTCQSAYEDSMSFVEGIHPDDRADMLNVLEGVKTKGEFQKEYRVIRPDGSMRWIFDRGFPIRNADGELLRMAGIAEDITERKLAEKELILFRSLIDHATDSIEVINPESGRFIDVNEKACREHGYSRDEFLKLHVSDIETKLDTQTVMESIRTKRFLILEGMHRRKDGSIFPVEINASFIHLDRDYIVAVVRDITERKREEAEREELFKRVAQTRDRLQQMSAWLMDAQEAERRRIARELHDEVGQTLTALKLGLEMSEKQPDAVWKDYLRASARSVDELLARVRNISLDLRPAMLDDMGLLPALLWHFERFTTMTRVRVDFQHHGLEQRRFPPEIETAAYRIMQEALTNVARHAGVKQATARVWTNEQMLGVQVEDQGRGFDAAAALTAANSSGLYGMRERVTLLGGDFEIESAAGRGTRLNILLPVEGRAI